MLGDVCMPRPFGPAQRSHGRRCSCTSLCAIAPASAEQRQATCRPAKAAFSGTGCLQETLRLVLWYTCATARPLAEICTRGVRTMHKRLHAVAHATAGSRRAAHEPSIMARGWTNWFTTHAPHFPQMRTATNPPRTFAQAVGGCATSRSCLALAVHLLGFHDLIDHRVDAVGNVVGRVYDGILDRCRRLADGVFGVLEALLDVVGDALHGLLDDAITDPHLHGGLACPRVALQLELAIERAIGNLLRQNASAQDVVLHKVPAH